MNSTKAERTARLFSNLARLGLSPVEVSQLLRIERTLSNWSTAECNGEIERDEDTGKPIGISRAYLDGMSDKRREYPVADREAGALKRLAKIMQPHKRRLIAYHQGDPRGCALYILRKRDVRPGEAIDSIYYRGVAVCL